MTDSRTRNFGQRPFLVEPVRGLRAWRFCCCDDCDDPALYALAHRSTWAPGENLAVCTPNPVAALLSSEALVHKDIAGAGCSCGFYAYFDSGRDQVAVRVDTVVGIVEGYGNVTVGTLGFRASKARVVAFVRHWRSVIGDVPKLDAVLETYGVPIYGTLEDALAEHPLTKPADVGVEAPPERTPSPIAGMADLAAAMGVSAAQAAAGFDRLLAALNQVQPPRRRRYAPGGLVVARGGDLRGIRLAGANLDKVGRPIGNTWTSTDEPRLAPLDPLERKRQRQEQAAEQRRSAGLRGSGGFDKKGRRR